MKLTVEAGWRETERNRRYELAILDYVAAVYLEDGRWRWSLTTSNAVGSPYRGGPLDSDQAATREVEGLIEHLHKQKAKFK
ncbi:hypothetical protein ACFRAQ_34815 [Nocardia sp. NPDC056611]|uniref:hypothetical protein n=1 Tax=Nocardia sp. NPDC056611 TaxID=3345877 RepID=UPI00366E4EAB